MPTDRPEPRGIVLDAPQELLDSPWKNCGMDRTEVKDLLYRQKQKLERAINDLTEIRASLPESEQARLDQTLDGLRECLAEDVDGSSRS